mmetsp:Transcript_85822/g.255873  ORF Transcript_85822/g.255873 Transcript_85822/m.255873 type:complete len:222 (+) Transcript_85822:649-1314(+)
MGRPRPRTARKMSPHLHGGGPAARRNRDQNTWSTLAGAILHLRPERRCLRRTPQMRSPRTRTTHSMRPTPRPGRPPRRGSCPCRLGGLHAAAAPARRRRPKARPPRPRLRRRPRSGRGAGGGRDRRLRRQRRSSSRRHSQWRGARLPPRTSHSWPATPRPQRPQASVALGPESRRRPARIRPHGGGWSPRGGPPTAVARGLRSCCSARGQRAPPGTGGGRQ